MDLNNGYYAEQYAKVLREAIEAVIKVNKKPEIIIGRAINVTDTVCDIDRGEGSPMMHGARLNALDEGTDTYMTVVPKEESWVLAGIIEDDRNEGVVISVTEIQKIIWKCGEDTTLLFEEGKTWFNGGSNGGIPINSKILENLNTIKSYLQTMNGAIASALTTIDTTAGSASVGTYNTTMSGVNLNMADMENPKVKH